MKIIPLNITLLLSIVLCIAMLAGCSSNNSIVSSFSQRKYTKGYFADAIGSKPSVIASKTNKVEDKKAISGIQKNNNLSNIVSLKDCLKTIRSTLAKVSVSIRVKQKPKEANQGLTVVEQIKGTPAESSTTSDTGEDAQRKKIGITLLVIGVVLLGLGLFFLHNGLLSFLGIILAILGISKFFKAEPQNNDGPSKNDTVPDSVKYDSALGRKGLLLVLGSMLIAYCTSGLVLGLAIGGGSSYILTIALVGSVITLALFVIGIIICIKAVKGKDEYHEMAITGLIIAGTIIAVALLIAILLLFKLK